MHAFVMETDQTAVDQTSSKLSCLTDTLSSANFDHNMLLHNEIQQVRVFIGKKTHHRHSRGLLSPQDIPLWFLNITCLIAFQREPTSSVSEGGDI